MDLKKHLVYFMLAIFMLARVQPAVPLLKAIPVLAHNIAANITAICSDNKTTNILNDVSLADHQDNDDKDTEKEGEKEPVKTVKESPEMFLHHHAFVVTLYATSNFNLFQLSLSGKVRNHVNEVFRPPLA